MKGQSHKFYLSNGIKCICYRVTDIHSVSINVTVKIGSLDEDEKSTGISHFLEHLAFDGTKEFKTWEEVDDFSNSISGSGNAYTTFDVTSFHGVYPYRYLDDAIKYYSQLVVHPLHTKEDVEKERGIILDELKRDADSVDTKVIEVLLESRFAEKNTPFSRQIIGTTDNLKKYTREDLRSFYEKNYTPENIQIFIVGNFELDDLKKSLEKHFAGLTKSTGTVHEYESKFPEYTEFSVDSKFKGDVDQLYLTLSFPGLTLKDHSFRDRLISKFANYVVANPQFQKSILWRRLREELGMVYGVYADNLGLFSRSMNYIETSFAPDNLQTVLEEAYSGVERIKEKGEGEEIFKMILKRVIDTEEMRYDNPEQVLNWIIKQDREQELHGQSYQLEEYIDLVKGIEFSEIIQKIKESYDWDKVNIGAVSTLQPDEMNDKITEAWKKVKK